MKQFLAIYTGSDAGTQRQKWNSLTEVDRQEKIKAGMAAWTNWVAKYSKSIVFQGGPVGKTKQTNLNGITDIKNEIAAFTVVSAESQEMAAKMFVDHPHFSIFPGDSVEVMECLPIPEQNK